VSQDVTPSTSLNLRDEAQDGSHTLSLSGELDIVTAPILEAALELLCEQGASEIVLDLHELAFIDSSGLRLILAGRQRCERHGCDFALTRPRPVAQSLFETTGVMGRLSFRARAFADGIRRRPPAKAKAPLGRTRPHHRAVLDLNLGAPRSARTFVGELLRDGECERMRELVMLLTSELVTPIAQLGAAVFVEPGELWVWIGAEAVRVELCVPGELLSAPPELSRRQYERTLLDKMADRWSIETRESSARVWFEVDCRRSAVASEDGSPV
jgi:anti-anti-sigma factor